MAEQPGQERTEDATPRRREDARRDGQVAKSAELNAAVLLLGSALLLQAMGPALGRAVMALFAGGLAAVGSAAGDDGIALALARQTGWRVLALLAPLLAALAAVSVAVAALQARGVASLKPITPDLSRLDPVSNARRMFGVRSVAELLKAVIKLVAVGLVVWSTLRSAWPELLGLAQRSPAGLLDVVRRHAVRLMATAGASYLALALADYLFQRWQHERGLRMTKEEVRQEAKQTEGDPMVKARMRSLGRARARRRMLADVPEADVIVVNPTHIAVALRYDPDTAPAPVVLAMGQRKVAERIRALAFEHGIPVVQNKPLARALFATAKVGMLIPAELYAAVAEILAFVYRQRAMAPARWRGSELA